MPGRPGHLARWYGSSTLALLGTAAVFLFAVDRWMEARAAESIFGDIGAVPAHPVGVVFGARVYGDGTLSPVLDARVTAGVRLYRAGKVRKLLMTGDNGRKDYDEPTAMKHRAVALGVPPEDVVCDFAGFRTYDSCYRARDVFGVRSAVLITQAFHLPRALFLARALGLDVVGYAALPGLDRASLRHVRRREFLARSGAVLDAALRRPPHFLGRQEPLLADARPDP